MSRSDKRISDRKQIDDIIRRCRVCRIGLLVDGHPYVVPLCFGYDGISVYFHMSRKGKKMAGLNMNSNVCLEWDLPGDVIESSDPCGWSMSYESVIGYGSVEFLKLDDAKRKGLNFIMQQYVGKNVKWNFPSEKLEKTVVLKVQLERISGMVRPNL
jgi:nitroimidazol reductase NimA-like FMN-containing flavoprotein (pyridoxamine 5'-phosphate oxidase superfamily)